MSLTSHEAQILNQIIVASDNDPGQPEFPPENPCFPATPTYQIQVPGYTNVWLKDESKNPTGTHKDRLAWEVVVTYRQFLRAKQRNGSSAPLPQMSIISSGSAATAIQAMLSRYGLPPLKALVDRNLSPELQENLRTLGCEVYTTDLSRRLLDWKDILELTDNEAGFDLTSGEALDPTTRFYDWLSYEILNESPEYCFVPFGTGNLFENILNVAKREVLAADGDPRFQGEIEVVEDCCFMGATTSNPDSKAAEKLYSPHLPFAHFDEQWIRFYRLAGFCNPQSGVYQIEENFLEQAMQLAQEQGIACEPSGIAGLALFLQKAEVLNIPADAKVLVVNTGKSHLP